MRTLDIVSNNIVQKNIFLDGQPINVLDFGTITKANIVTKDKNLSKVSFIRREPSQSVLGRYGIDYNEYDNICNRLKAELESYLF